MPETLFTIRWPDGQEERCYSPSTIVFDYLAEGQDYPLDEFMTRAGDALEAASERVRARYGYACSSAMDQLRLLQSKEDQLKATGLLGQVRVLSLNSKGKAASSRRTPAVESKSTERIPVVVVGGGQAGLSMSYLLKQRNVDHVVLEKNRIAHSWRSERWDSFCLVTPNWQCRLPGYEYQGEDPDGFMVKDQIVEFLEGYARSFEPKVRENVTVTAVRKTASGLSVETTAGCIETQQVVIATGGYHTPKLPSFAQSLPEDIVQVHSRDYKSPEQLPKGPVLVVGSGQSGCQIVEDLMLKGRRVHLCVGDAPRCARRYRGKDVVEWLEMMGHYDIPIDDMPDPAAARSKTNHYVTGRDGGHDIDLREFALRGLSLHGSAVDYRAGQLIFAPNLKPCLDAADDTYRRINDNIDRFIQERGISCPPGHTYQPVWEPVEDPPYLDLKESGIRSIVWSIGFAANYDWVKLDVFDERGFPIHQRGITGEPGLYFLGLPWLHTWGSGRFCGVAQDAEFLMSKIAELQKTLQRASALV